MNSSHVLSHNRTTAGRRVPHFSAVLSNADGAAAGGRQQRLAAGADPDLIH